MRTVDDLPAYSTSPEVLADSVARTHRWEARSLRAHLADVRQQAIYGVVHGGLDLRMRTRSVEYLASLPFDGFAVGGSVRCRASTQRPLGRAARTAC